MGNNELPCAMISTDETCGYERSFAKEHMTNAANVELESGKETTEAHECPWRSWIARSQVSAPVHHREILSRSTSHGARRLRGFWVSLLNFELPTRQSSCKPDLPPSPGLCVAVPRAALLFYGLVPFLFFSRAHAYIKGGPMPLLVNLPRPWSRTNLSDCG